MSVSTRTIRRDLQALQEAGFAVYDEGEENETKRWRLDTQPFRAVAGGLSVADVAALYLSRSVVESLSGWPLADELRSAFAKIERALNPRMREFLSTLPQVMSAKAGPKPRQPSGLLVDVTRRLFDAARDRRVVEMRYFSATSNRAKIVRRSSRTGWRSRRAACTSSRGCRSTTSSGRLPPNASSGCRSPTTRSRRRASCPPTSFDRRWACSGASPNASNSSSTPRVAPFVRGRVWHDSQQVDDSRDGRLKMTLLVSNDWALRSWVLGFGAGVIVNHPVALKSSVGDEFRRAQARYTSS